MGMSYTHGSFMFHDRSFTIVHAKRSVTAAILSQDGSLFAPGFPSLIHAHRTCILAQSSIYDLSFVLILSWSAESLLPSPTLPDRIANNSDHSTPTPLLSAHSPSSHHLVPPTTTPAPRNPRRPLTPPPPQPPTLPPPTPPRPPPTTRKAPRTSHRR